MTRPHPSGPDPAQVARTVAYLSKQDDARAFPRALADMVMTKIPTPQVEDFPSQIAFERAVEAAEIDREELAVEQAAFRSPQLVNRSLAAARLLLDETNATLRRGRRDDETKTQWADRQRRLKHFVLNVGRERRLLEQIITGLRAQSGVLPNAPNPRQRAFERLAKEHPKQYLQLLRYEQRLEKERKAEARRAAKEAAKQAKREKRSGGGGGGALPALAAVAVAITAID